MNSKRNLVVLHVLGCITFLVLTLLLAPHPPHESIFTFSRPMQRDSIANVLMLGFFYLNFYALIPKLYFKEKYITYGLVIAGSFLIVCLLPSLLTMRFGNPFPGENIRREHFRPGPPPQPSSAFVSEISHHIFLFLAVVLFSLLLKVRSRLFQAETAKQHAELSYLKAQINPHFLFNTLNSIYSLAITKDERTPEAVIQLSELMRYIIRDAKDDMISLEKEINYINNYIALQTSRLGDTVNINYKVKGETLNKKIAPLILATYIENAFKHGVNPDEVSEININISIAERDLRLLVYNRKVHSGNNEEGIGVQNTKERLDLLYPTKHKLVINDTNDSYTVELIITLE